MIRRLTSTLAATVLFLGLTSRGDAIIHGNEAGPGTDPLARHAVALQMSEIQSDGSIRYYKGSAVLIADRVLLTAGHNVAYVPNPGNIEAIFSVTPCWGPNVCGEKRARAVQAIVHPFFRQIPGGTEFDLALVKLSSDVPMSHVPIAVVGQGRRLASAHVLGFGTDRESGDVPPDAFRLRSIDLAPIDPRYELGDTQKFWLDQRNGGICSGDSGGPAVLEIDGKNLLVGIAIHVTYSGGASHCLTKAAFTDLLHFRNWIESNIARPS